MNKRTSTINTNPSSVLPPRGLRILQVAQYSALSPFFIEEPIRNGTLPAIGGPGSGVCSAYVILREHIDQYLDALGDRAVERAEERRKTFNMRGSIQHGHRTR
jgi:hypothetical protein